MWLYCALLNFSCKGSREMGCLSTLSCLSTHTHTAMPVSQSSKMKERRGSVSGNEYLKIFPYTNSLPFYLMNPSNFLELFLPLNHLFLMNIQGTTCSSLRRTIVDVPMHIPQNAKLLLLKLNLCHFFFFWSG